MLTFDPANLVIESTASITDLPVFHSALRAWEESATGVVWPVTHAWKALDLGGAYFYQADLSNGWRLKFPNAGNYTISGNLNASIIPVAGVYVERKTSAAFATTSQGSSGPSAADIAAAVWGTAPSNLGSTPESIASAVLSTLQASVLPSNMVQVRGQPIVGAGTADSPWGPA